MASPSNSDGSLAEASQRWTHSRSFSDPTPSLCIIGHDDIPALSPEQPSSCRSTYESVLYDDNTNEDEDFYSSLDSAENKAKRSWLQSGFANGFGSRLSNIGSYLRSFGEPTTSNDPSRWSMGGKLNHVWNNFKYGKWKMRPHEGEYEKEVSIWLLGCHYHPNRVDSETRDGFQRFFIDYHSRIWLTYRTGFPPFPGTSVTSDCGWGCMLRTAQMVVAEALVQLHLGRDWRWNPNRNESRKESDFLLHNKIIQLFEDHLGADLSIHRLMRIAARNTENTPIGKWYTPSHSVALLKEALKDSHSEETEALRICLCTDGLVIKSEVEVASEEWTKPITMSISIKDLLPPPLQTESEAPSYRDPWFGGRDETVEEVKSESKISTEIATITKEPPPYGQRSAYKPRFAEDFGDGGAFPEIHVAQHPLNMGLGKRQTSQSKTLALQYDADGNLQHDVIARQGHQKNKIVYTKLSDMKSKLIPNLDEEASMQRPEENSEEVRAITEATSDALGKLVQSKIASALPVQHAQKQGPSQYIRYTPSDQSGNSGAQQRIIRMVEEQKDPMEPPKFKINQKIPRGPPSPPAPVLHSPTRKVTAKEQADWKIPPCISNWKNPKGYTVALDKRLAADGRGMQQAHINENFAKLAEALYIADRKAREAVEARANMERRVAQNKKAEQEEMMREMAAKARKERLQGRKDDRDDEGAQERDKIRRERAEDRRRERNMNRNHPDRAKREKERDISEKIALGLPDTRARTGETQFDQRLFNQSKGLDSGGIDDETHSVYDKPWRPQDNVQQHIYRPSKNIDKDIYGSDLDAIISANKFVPEKGFSGTEGGGSSGRGAGPVQFEKDDEDVFGIGSLLKSTKEGKRRGDDDDAGSSKRSRR
ncbi:hypothetical protein QR680_001155 [Steinernema hermaphroditum]|uniref:Cysteine protease n=1 Tax=Steinernema hermaphroditum TaxID=289476 RepID=A0AA39GZW8_9BILA|nr:hypothetical protein QR680_001155 [Steinernema hermaphroditum]